MARRRTPPKDRDYIGLADLTRRVARIVHMSYADADTVCRQFLNEMVKVLYSGKRLKLTGYFSVQAYLPKPKVMYDINTGEKKETPRHVHFKVMVAKRIKELCEEIFLEKEGGVAE